jgi:hypothetical protein
MARPQIALGALRTADPLPPPGCDATRWAITQSGPARGGFVLISYYSLFEVIVRIFPPMGAHRRLRREKRTWDRAAVMLNP